MSSGELKPQIITSPLVGEVDRTKPEALGGRVRGNLMQHALDLAALAAEQGEVPVGAVLVDSTTNQVLAAGHNCCETRLNPLLHAEMMVIEQACRAQRSKTLDKCHLYVTLEPCLMCAMAIAYARIERVYYGASDEKFGAIEHGPRIFYSQTTTSLHKPEIYSGIMAEESKALLQEFFRGLRSSKA